MHHVPIASHSLRQATPAPPDSFVVISAMSWETQRRIYDRADPRFNSILRSGRAVSTSDWAFACGILAENESLTQYHENALRILKENHRTILSIVAPIRKVPPEVLSYIFAHFIESNRFGPRKKGCVSNASKLGEVCSYWRSVSLTTPSLWAKLEVKIDFSISFDPIVLQDLKRHVDRANHALDLTLTFDGEGGSTGDDVIESLFPSSREWRSLCLTIRGGFEQTVISILHDHLAERLNLQSLENLDNATSDEGRIILDTFVSRSSLLRRIYLPVSDSYLEPDNLGLYASLFSRLTHLLIGNTAETILLFLEHCSGLVSAHFVIPVSEDADGSSERDDNGQGKDSISRKTYKMLQLQNLAIEVPDADTTDARYPLQGAAQIMQAITCPGLQSLSLICDADTHQSASGPTEKGSLLRSLHDFFERSQALLLHFHVERIPFSDEELTSLLQRTPSLIKLTISETARRGDEDIDENETFTDDFFEWLSWPSSEESYPDSMYLLPRLRDLRITIICELRGLDAKFADLVKSRLIESQPPSVLNPLSRLQSFYLKALYGDRGWLHIRFSDTLRELKEERDMAVRFVSFKTNAQTHNGRRIYEYVESEIFGHGEDDDYGRIF